MAEPRKMPESGQVQKNTPDAGHDFREARADELIECARENRKLDDGYRHVTDQLGDPPHVETTDQQGKK